MTIGYEIPEDVEKPNSMGFIFTTESIRANMANTNTLDQFITYRKKEGFGPWKTVVCSVTLGEAGSEQVINFSSKQNYHGMSDLITFDRTEDETAALGSSPTGEFFSGRQRNAEEAKG